MKMYECILYLDAAETEMQDELVKRHQAAVTVLRRREMEVGAN